MTTRYTSRREYFKENTRPLATFQELSVNDAADAAAYAANRKHWKPKLGRVSNPLRLSLGFAAERVTVNEAQRHGLLVEHHTPVENRAPDRPYDLTIYDVGLPTGVTVEVKAICNRDAIMHVFASDFHANKTVDVYCGVAVIRNSHNLSDCRFAIVGFIPRQTIVDNLDHWTVRETSRIDPGHSWVNVDVPFQYMSFDVVAVCDFFQWIRK